MSLLRAVLDRIIPADDWPSATQAGVDGFVLGLWAQGLVPQAEAMLAGLAALDGRGPPDGGFAGLPEAGQDRCLAAVEAEPWFGALCELAAEGYYADPSNGGNAGAASWAMMGYRPGLPEGPDGPPANPRDARAGVLWAPAPPAAGDGR